MDNQLYGAAEAKNTDTTSSLLGLGFVHEMLSDDVTRRKLENSPFWPYIVKTGILTFNDEADAYANKQEFEALVLKIMRNTPACKQNQDFFILADQARIIAHSNINRARGTERKMVNERVANIMQISESYINQTGAASNTSGIRGRVMGMFGRR